MKFNIGDYFMTRTGKEGYILELTKFGHNQTAFVLGFVGDIKSIIEYTNNGVYDKNDFILFEDYFVKIGNYDFQM